MTPSDHKNYDERLNRLFEEYRGVCADRDGGANFMPGMWQKIEANRNSLVAWQWMGRRVLAGAAGLAVVLGLIWISPLQSSVFYHSTYVEALDADQETDELASILPISFGDTADRR